MLLLILAITISLGDNKSATKIVETEPLPETTKLVWRVWITLIIVMIALYIFFNGF